MRLADLLTTLFGKRRSSATDQGGEPLRCSFCNKAQQDVGKLIAGPTAFICDECVEICVDIIEEDRKLAGSAVASSDRGGESGTSGLSPVVAACSLCRLPVPVEHLVAVPDRGALCRPCVEAVVLTQTPPGG